MSTELDCVPVSVLIARACALADSASPDALDFYKKLDRLSSMSKMSIIITAVAQKLAGVPAPIPAVKTETAVQGELFPAAQPTTTLADVASEAPPRLLPIRTFIDKFGKPGDDTGTKGLRTRLVRALQTDLGCTSIDQMLRIVPKRLVRSTGVGGKSAMYLLEAVSAAGLVFDDTNGWEAFRAEFVNSSKAQ